jgi:hypothetical protein
LREERAAPFEGVPRSHPSVVDGYRRGFEDGVLTTLDELAKAHNNELPIDIAYWAKTVREKVEADRG